MKQWCTTHSGLAIVLLVFVVLRLPLVLCTPGMMDEEHYAVVGLTVAQEGIPRNPFIPSRDPRTVFFRSDEALFAMPPAFFYWSAPAFWLFDGTYSVARCGSFLAGAIAIVLVYVIALRAYKSVVAATVTSLLYSLTRFFFFPAITARPDMLCGMFGLLAMWMLLEWLDTPRHRTLIGLGLAIGFGGLTHFYAIAFAMLAGMWVFIGSFSPRSNDIAWYHRTHWLRAIVNVAIVGLISMAVMALWLPLILAFPEIAKTQLANQLLVPEEHGVFYRLVMPWESLAFIAQLLWIHLGRWQFLLFMAAIPFVVIGDGLRGEKNARRTCWVAITGVYFLSVCQGLHYANGYWCYGGAMCCILLGRAIEVMVSKAPTRMPRAVAWTVGVAVALVLLIPGSGLRSWWVLSRSIGRSPYDARVFAREVLDTIPPDARCIVDEEFVFDCYRSGRPTLTSHIHPMYFDASKEPYDYLILSRMGVRKNRLASFPEARLVTQLGMWQDDLACYAEIHEKGGRSLFRHDEEVNKDEVLLHPQRRD